MNNGQQTMYDSQTNQLTRIVSNRIVVIQLTEETQTIAHVARLSSLENETFELMSKMQGLRNGNN